MIRISIIIPVYNVEKYIRRCIESVMTQSVSGLGIECILVNDCTPDDSMRIVNEMIDSYQGPIQFVVLQHDKNRGLSAARNTGEAHANGNYILFIDSDDWILPDSLQYFATYLAKYPSVDIIMAQHVRSDNTSEKVRGKDTVQYINEPQNILNTYFHRNQIHAWNILVKKKLLAKNGIKFINGIIHEDVPWTYHLFSNAESILVLPKITYMYEIVPTSIMNTEKQLSNAKKGITGYAIGIEDILNNPPKAPLLVVDYIIYITHILMWCVDLIVNVPVAREDSCPFRAVRRKFLRYTIRNKRFLLSTYLLLLYPPFCYLIKLPLFRRNFHKLEMAASRLSHLAET